MKETFIKFSNQSHRHHNDIDNATVEEPQKINEYKAMSPGQLYQSVWKNPLVDTPKDTKRDKNQIKIVKSQCSYDTVYRQPSMNHQYTFSLAQFENKMKRAKSVDAWIDKLSPLEIQQKYDQSGHHHGMATTTKLTTY